MSTLIAGVSHANLSGRDFVGETEKTSVGTSIGTEALRTEKIDSDESTNEQEGNGDGYRGKSLPKIGGNQVVGELRNKRLVFRSREES
jgi:hypothetical protein